MVDLLKMDPEDALDLLKSLPRPKAVAASPECRAYFAETVLPLCERQALSELTRKNEAAPRLMGFMDDGSMGLIDVSKAMGSFGDARTKQATAVIHKLAALLPGVRASVFCVEAWVLHQDLVKGANVEETVKKHSNIADHPDRTEAIMINMLYYIQPDHTVMQLIGMLPILKVLGHNLSRDAWRSTKFGPVDITDPVDATGGKRMEGRFIAD
jgi:hypothetical protein